MQSSDRFRLVVRRGPQPNQTFELNKDIITLGRDITNDIVLNDPEASRHHLRLTRGADGYNIEDLGSTNGTFINGQRLTGVRPLNRGDMIGLGETVTLGYEVVREGGEAAPGGAMPTQQHAEFARPPQQPSGEPGYGQQQPPQQPQYDQQQPQYGQQPPQQPGAPPPPPEYGGDYAPPEYGYAPQGPPGAGYDYDPYAMREEEPNTLRWILIGCALLFVVCCCASTIGLIIIDQADLWEDIPVFSDVITPIFRNLGEAVGIVD